jgi:hypothetical protein
VNWLKRIFGVADDTAARVEKAGDRLAAAFEQMADDAEKWRDTFRARMGVEGGKATKQLAGK